MGGAVLGRLARMGRAIAAWLTLYVALGGLAGCMLAQGREPFRLFGDGVVVPAQCWPELSLFDLIDTRCAMGLWDVLWFLGVGAPRLLTGVVGMAVVFAADLAQRPWQFDLDLSLALAGLLALSAGLVLGYWVGVAFWWRRARWAAVAAALCLVTEHGIYIAGVGL